MNTPPLDAAPAYLSGIPDTDYHAPDGRVSSSGLKALQRSPAHYLAEYGPDAVPREEIQALLLGRLLHAVTLEGREEFMEAHDIDRRTKAGKEAWARLQEEADGRAILKADQVQMVRAVAAAVRAHPMAALLLEQGAAEVSGYFTDPETGVHCKTRPDWLRVDDGVVVDLKSTIDAGPGGFPREISRYSYHLSAAMYAHGFEVITGEPLRDFVFIAVEKTPPYAVGVYRLDDEAMEAGRRLYRRALRTYAECLASDRWPGYGEDIQTISVPAWALNTHDDEETTP